MNPAPAHPRVLLLGLGNEILTDDSIGLRIVGAARDRLQEHPHITVSQTSEMGLALLDFIVGYDAVILVDAIQTGQAAVGFAHEMDETALKRLPAISPHFLGLGEALALGRSLGLAVPNRLKIFAIEVKDPFTVGAGLTPALQAALPDLVDRVVSAALAVC